MTRSLAFVVFLAALAAAPAARADMHGVASPGRVQLVEEGCPSDPAHPCADVQRGVIYVPRGSEPFAKQHELGHVFDFRRLALADREAFMRLMRRPAVARCGWLEVPPAGCPLTPAGEMFGSAYAACRLGLRPDRGQWVSTYGYEPGPKRHRRVCKWMRGLGR